MNLAKYADALIPGVIGLLLVIEPGVFLGKQIVDETRRGRIAKLRSLGCILVVIAASYALMTALK